MSLRPWITSLASVLWAARRPGRQTIAYLDRPFEQRYINTFLLPIELQETINSEVAKRLRSYHSELKAALQKKNIDDVCDNLSASRREFFTLPRQAWKYVCENHLRLTKDEFEEMVHLLSGRLKKTEAAALAQLIRDARAMYGIEPTSETFLTALNCMIRSKQQQEAYDLFLLVRSFKTRPFRINSQHWSIAMHGLSQCGEVEKLKECLDMMKRSLPFPGNDHYHALLFGLFRRAEPPSVDEVLRILDELQRLNFPFYDLIHTTLKKIGRRIGHDSLPSEYSKRCTNRPKPTETQIEEWLNKLIIYRKRARAAFETKLIAFRNEGFYIDEYILSRYAQLASLASPPELIYLQEVLDLPVNDITWSICIRNVLQKNGWKSALEAYEVARAQGVKSQAAMIDPLLRVMFNRLHGQSGEVIDKALELYEDLKEDAKSGGSKGADISLFNLLLRELAASNNKRKHFPIALKLLEDMRREGVRMDPMTATSVAVLLVRSSSTYEEAAEAYKQVHSVNAEGLDAKGFIAVLHAFSALELGDASPDESPDSSGEIPSAESERRFRNIEPTFSIPPAKLYFNIVQSMYDHGFHKTSEAYTILLGRYATLATRARAVRDAERRDAIVSTLRNAIKETHRQLSLEAGLVPDVALWNQLMDAYNRAGLFRDVMQIWTTLYSTGLITPAGVSIVLDACGFQKEPDQAAAILRDLRERGFKLNRRNWNSWVECLCRTGRLDKALEVVCYEMKHAKDPELRPDSQTIQLLRSFGVAHGKLEEVQQYLRKHLPNLAF